MLPRFGFSGARLFIVNFAERGLPFIFKVAPIAKAEEEIDAVHSLKDFGIEDCERVRIANDSLLKSDCGKWGGILYPHMGTDDTSEAEEALTLKQRLFYAEKPIEPLPDGDLEKILREVFRRLGNAHRKPTWDTRPVSAAYGRYFRKHESKMRIRQILGSLAGQDDFQFLNAPIRNPIKCVESLPDSAILPMSRVHGDLHPDNVVLHRCGTPHLIDFAWSKDERDVLVDFVLMENSIRFRDFPRTVNLDEQLVVDEALVTDESFNGTPAFHSCDDKNSWAYGRLANATGLIRQAARSVLGDHFSVERYLFSQFIVLYGLLRFEGYEPYTSVRALGLIAKRLHGTGWGFLDQVPVR